MPKKQNSFNQDSGRPLRISIYIYPAQLRQLEEIGKKRKKPKRWIFLEAIQTYIGLYRNGGLQNQGDEG